MIGKFLSQRSPVLLGICGLLLLADAAWIEAKAFLAQELIAAAWKHPRISVLPWPWADHQPVARLWLGEGERPLYVLLGAQGNSLAFGPGRLHGSASPGYGGVSIVGGHRDTQIGRAHV